MIVQQMCGSFLKFKSDCYRKDNYFCHCYHYFCYFGQINNSAKFSFPGIGTRLEEKLGKIEKVKGYILIRESSSLTSLNFLKNLKEISPRQGFVFGGPFEPKLYNDRYAYERLLSLLY